MGACSSESDAPISSSPTGESIPTEDGFSEATLRSPEFRNCFYWMLNQGVISHTHELESSMSDTHKPHGHSASIDQFSNFGQVIVSRSTSKSSVTAATTTSTKATGLARPQSCGQLIQLDQ